MAFNKGILMLAIIASTGIFEATCLSLEWKNKILNFEFINKCRESQTETEFNGLLDSSMTDFEKCETYAVFSELSQRKENAKTPMFSVQSDFQLLCNATFRIFTCAENFLDSVLFCESQPSRDRRNLIAGAIHSYAGYLCSKNAKRLAVSTRKFNCIKKSFNRAKCFDEILLPAEFLYKMEIYNRTFVPKIEKCVLDTFDQCPSTNPLFSPSAMAQKFMTDFKKLAGSIFNLAKSTQTDDEFLDDFFFDFAF